MGYLGIKCIFPFLDSEVLPSPGKNVQLFPLEKMPLLFANCPLNMKRLM